MASASCVRARLAESAMTASILSARVRCAAQARYAESTPPEYATSRRPSRSNSLSSWDDLAASLGSEDGIALWYQAAPTRLIQPFLPPEVAERGDVRQAKGEPVEILVPHIRDCIAPVLQRKAAAVPIVGGLSGCKLHLLCLHVEA